MNILEEVRQSDIYKQLLFFCEEVDHKFLNKRGRLLFLSPFVVNRGITKFKKSRKHYYPTFYKIVPYRKYENRGYIVQGGKRFGEEFDTSVIGAFSMRKSSLVYNSENNGKTEYEVYIDLLNGLLNYIEKLCRQLGFNEEYEFIRNISKNDLPLYVTHIWTFNLNSKFYCDRLNNKELGPLW